MCFWAGQSWMCNKRSVKSVRRHALHWKSLRMRAHFQTAQNTKIWSFIKTTMHFIRFAKHAALSHTHPSRHRLRGIEAAFTLCLLRFRTRLLALSSLLPSQLLPFWRCDNETTSTATALRMMNLLAFLSVTNCIPECDKLLFWAWQIAFPSVTNCVPEHDTTPPPTKNTHCKISSLALRHSAIRSLVL